MSTIHPAMAPADKDTTPPATPPARRSDQSLADARRAWAGAEKARARYEASLVTRDAALAQAMADGWTSDELGEMFSVTGDNIRSLLYQRRKGRGRKTPG